MATAQTSAPEVERAFWTTGVAVFIPWNVMTATGALIGDAIVTQVTLDEAGRITATRALLGSRWPLFPC